jgi:hypothetical protein
VGSPAAEVEEDMHRANHDYETLRDVLDDLEAASFFLSPRDIATAAQDPADDGAASDDDTLTEDGAGFKD